jgi:putative long chain acyl-CoA synthase
MARKKRLRRWAKRSAQNALELYRLGRLTPVEGLSFDVVDQSLHCRLRRYPVLGAPATAPLLLIPPLMLTAEIYDVDPDTSAVRKLTAAGVDTWVVDFGAPERESGGMERTLDDHVRGVAWAIERVRALTGRDVHLAGYSQGGMFAYQAAAYCRGEGVASLVTFGSPVDIHRNLPAIESDVAARFIRAVSPLVELTLDSVEGIPGQLNSLGFKLLSPRKEVEQLVDFVRKLHDRQELARRESRRRFLAGEGFVAWPGPALRRFFDDFVVHNRMVAGGIVIDGRTVTLADIQQPILAFVGDRDEFARPAAVRAIQRAAPSAELHEIELPAGHFGLVVGSVANRVTWPAVIDWIRWRDGTADIPHALARPSRLGGDEEPEDWFDPDLDFEALTSEATQALRRTWLRAADVVRDAGETFDHLRFQVPRLRRLENMTGGTRISASRILAEQAATIGERTFFLWKGRAFSYAEANARVDNVVRGLIACGIRPGERVAVLMGSRPSYLSAVTALNRLGAVAVLLAPELSDSDLAKAVSDLSVGALMCDPDHAARARLIGGERTRLVLGGFGSGDARQYGVAIDMEAIEPDEVALPAWYRPDAGTARMIAMVLVQPRRGGVRISRISNGRWAFSALGFAAAATLRPIDTVYCALPLHHPTGLFVSVGGALVGGSRLALSRGFDPSEFWSEVRRYGATVVSYAGDMARPLCEAPVVPGERNHPVRVFAGSGMRSDVWRRLQERFGVGVLELYASTERNLVLANASGAKIGSIGRVLPGSSEVALVELELRGGRMQLPEGTLQRAHDRPGLALIRVGEHVAGERIRADVFEPGDRWYVTDDVLRCDVDGDYWYVDKVDHLLVTRGGLVATPRLEDALMRAPGVRHAVAYGVRPETLGEEGEALVPVAAVRAENLDVARLSEVVRVELLPHERPRAIFVVQAIPHNTGFRPLRARLAAEGARPEGLEQTLRYDETTERYA